MKAALRGPLRTARRDRPPAERTRLAHLIAERAREIPELTAASVVAAYASLPDEPGTLPLREALRTQGKRVLLPVVPTTPDPPDTIPAPDTADRAGASFRSRSALTSPGDAGHTLHWALDDGTELVAGAGLGMPEPAGEVLGPEALAEAQVILVPALAVDTAGNRLGKGRGYYDAALSHAAPDALILAVLFDDEILADPIPAEPHDVRVHGALTPNRTVMF